MRSNRPDCGHKALRSFSRLEIDEIVTPMLIGASIHCSEVPSGFQPRKCAGSTDTSLWTHYSAGERDYCGNSFPDGMVKNDRLEQVGSAVHECLDNCH